MEPRAEGQSRTGPSMFMGVLQLHWLLVLQGLLRAGWIKGLE